MLNELHDSIVGVVFKNDKIKIVEVEPSTGNQYRITKITDGQLDFPFTVDNVVERKHIAHFGESLRSLMDQHGFNDRRVSFSLPNDFVIIKKYPYDFDFTGEEIEDQVDWEVKQFSFSTDDGYIIDSQKLKMSHSPTTKELVVVAARTAVVDYVKEVFKSANIRLKYLDAEVFAAIRAINHNYEIRNSERCALICIDGSGIYFTLLEDGDFFLTYRIAMKLDSEISNMVVTDSIIKVLSKELKRVIIDNKLGEKIEDLSRLFMYGDLVKDDLLRSFQNVYNVRIDRANPFRQLRFAQNVSVDNTIWSRPETFTVCVGSALR